MSIEEFIEASNKASSVDELFELYKCAMAALGFDRLIFSLMTDHLNIEKKAGHGIMLNYPEDWMKYYIEKQYDMLDPVRTQMYAADNIFLWDSLLSHTSLTKKQVTFFNQAEDAGLYNGIGIPLRGSNGAIAGIGAASSAGGVELDKNRLSFVNLLAHQFYTAFLSLEKNRKPRLFFLLTVKGMFCNGSQKEKPAGKWRKY